MQCAWTLLVEALACSVPFAWWKPEVPGQMRRTCTSCGWSLRACGCGGEQGPAVPAHLLAVRARSWPRAPARQLRALPPGLHDNSGSRRTAAPSQMLPCTWALIRWRSPAHKGVGNFAWFQCQKCVVVGWELGGAGWPNRIWFHMLRTAVCEPWVCRNAPQLMDRAKRVRTAEEGEVCFLFCPHTGCNFLFINVPGGNSGTKALHWSDTNCLEDPAFPSSQRRGFLF